jgi:hypothetical protein
VIPKDFELRRKIMDEAHYSRYSIHPGANKMYQDLKKNFWWTRMKREIAKYVSECDTCRRVKANHLRPARNLQRLNIPEWKWENICMDFIVGLPRRVQLDMGHYGSLDEVCLLHTCRHYIQSQAVCRVIYVTHRLLS